MNLEQERRTVDVHMSKKPRQQISFKAQTHNIYVKTRKKHLVKTKFGLDRAIESTMTD